LILAYIVHHDVS